MESYEIVLCRHTRSYRKILRGEEIKKATANNLTFKNIAYEAFYRKGIEIIGVVDCISPYVLEDIEGLLETGEINEKEDGGMEYGGSQTLLLGAEIETHEKGGCSAHSLSFFPDKSFYGNCCDSLREIFDETAFEKIPAVELGLSADAMMASQISELDGKGFISNSDAHSLIKMGREYNIFEMEEPSFNEVLRALKRIEGRKILANYGLNPLLGKYHRTFCLICNKRMEGTPPVFKCPVSEAHPVVMGVKDRIEAIKDRNVPKMSGRAPYHYQVPLEFLPKVGPKTIDRLIERFGNEMKILHEADYDELTAVVKEDIARNIILAREGKLGIKAGGGGIYGRIED